MTAEERAALKAELQREIAAIEREEKIVSELEQPQSLAEIEELQTKLKEALGALERRKAELEKH